jgi:hypothetical protein
LPIPDIAESAYTVKECNGCLFLASWETHVELCWKEAETLNNQTSRVWRDKGE